MNITTPLPRSIPMFLLCMALIIPAGAAERRCPASAPALDRLLCLHPALESREKEMKELFNRTRARFAETGYQADAITLEKRQSHWRQQRLSLCGLTTRAPDLGSKSRVRGCVARMTEERIKSLRNTLDKLKDTPRGPSTSPPGPR